MTCVWQTSTQSNAPKPLTGPRVKAASMPEASTSHTSHFLHGTSPVYLSSIQIYRNFYALHTEQYTVS